MTAITLNLDFVQMCLVENALETEIKAKFSWYRKLQNLKRQGVEVAGAQFENQVFFVGELNKQRRLLKKQKETLLAA